MKREHKLARFDLCETLIVYILLSTFQLVHMVLTVSFKHLIPYIDKSAARCGQEFILHKRHINDLP